MKSKILAVGFFRGDVPDPRPSSPMKVPGDAAGRDGALNKFFCNNLSFVKLQSKLDAWIQIFAGKCFKLGISTIFFFQPHLRGVDPGELRGLAAHPQWKLPPLLQRQFLSPVANYLSPGLVLQRRRYVGASTPANAPF